MAKQLTALLLLAIATYLLLQLEGKKNQNNAGCLLLKDNKFLAVKDKISKKWNFPGGTAKAHETPADTAARETFEETAIEVTPQQLLAVFDNGFHLFLCSNAKQGSTEKDKFAALEVAQNRDLTPEIIEQKWLASSAINITNWRFAKYMQQQMAIVEQQLNKTEKQ